MGRCCRTVGNPNPEKDPKSRWAVFTLHRSAVILSSAGGERRVSAERRARTPPGGGARARLPQSCDRCVRFDEPQTAAYSYAVTCVPVR